MVFWRKDNSSAIKSNLRRIRRKVNNLKKFESKARKAISIIDDIEEKIDDASREIRERANEEKAKPYIDLIYDRHIDAMANEEIKHLNKFKKNLADYRGYVEEAEKTEELDEVKKIEELDAVIELMEEEEEAITKREDHHERKIRQFEDATLRKRLETTSFSPPQGTTGDGTRFAYVAMVARQLGGWVEKAGGGHPVQIKFPPKPPHVSRPIPFSNDVDDNRLARQIRAQLIIFFPTHKIPTTSNLRNALRAGDIQDVA